MQKQLTNRPINYQQLISKLVKQLSDEKAAQLYAFARFLSTDALELIPTSIDDMDIISDDALDQEDQLWAAAMTRHAEKFAELKAKAKADAQAGKSIDAYDKNGEFVLK